MVGGTWHWACGVAFGRFDGAQELGLAQACHEFAGTAAEQVILCTISSMAALSLDS